ncbi:peptidylprolyl isomerase [Chloroflexota bacterium]
MPKLTLVALLALTLALLVAPVAAQDAPTPAEICAAATPASTGNQGPYESAEDVLAEDADYLAVFCTSAGPVLIDLFEEQTPATVNNMVFLAEQGYYDNTNFHRVIQDFMAQAGDPTNTGSGGPGYQFEDEIVDDLVFDRAGLLAMANAGAGTNGSQFFITTAATDWLNGNHTIFGEVLAGYDNVEDIQIRDPQGSFGPGTLLETIVILDDPVLVSVEEETFAPVTRADVEATWELLPVDASTLMGRYGMGFNFPELQDMFSLDEEITGIYETDAVVALAPAAVQDDLAEFYATYNHEYSGLVATVNEDCALKVTEMGFPVYRLQYQLDVFATPEDAEAAFADGTWSQLQLDQGLIPVEIPSIGPIFTGTTAACDQDDLIVAREMLPPVGRYLMTAEAVVLADIGEDAPYLPEVFTMTLFNNALHEIVRPEVDTNQE